MSSFSTTKSKFPFRASNEIARSVRPVEVVMLETSVQSRHVPNRKRKWRAGVGGGGGGAAEGDGGVGERYASTSTCSSVTRATVLLPLPHGASTYFVGSVCEPSSDSHV